MGIALVLVWIFFIKNKKKYFQLLSGGYLAISWVLVTSSKLESLLLHFPVVFSTVQCCVEARLQLAVTRRAAQPPRQGKFSISARFTRAESFLRQVCFALQGVFCTEHQLNTVAGRLSFAECVFSLGEKSKCEIHQPDSADFSA